MLRETPRLLHGKASSRTMVESALVGADLPAANHVFISRVGGEALALADQADRLSERGSSSLPFLGIPITVKDNFDIAGVTTTAGSRVLADLAPALEDAAVVQSLKRAGFILLGRTNMTELAFSGIGINPHFGTPSNPSYPGETRIPGGSSSGAAVSVALGIVPVAIGTDTGGSVRVPAALCGVVGFKPTASTISRAGVVSLSTTLDSVGILARSVGCCASLYGVLRDGGGCEKYVSAPPVPESINGLRIGVIQDTGADPVVEKAIERAIRVLSRAGARLTRVRLLSLEAIPAVQARGTFSAAEIYAQHRGLIVSGADLYDPRVLSRIMAGAHMSKLDYIALQVERARLIEQFGREVSPYDILLSPTVPMVAPTLRSLEDDDEYHNMNLRLLKSPSTVNFLDGCAISIPCHAPGEHPVGLSLIGRNGDDDHVLQVAAAIEPLIDLASR